MNGEAPGQFSSAWSTQYIDPVNFQAFAIISLKEFRKTYPYLWLMGVDCPAMSAGHHWAQWASSISICPAFPVHKLDRIRHIMCANGITVFMACNNLEN